MAAGEDILLQIDRESLQVLDKTGPLLPKHLFRNLGGLNAADDCGDATMTRDGRQFATAASSS
jgi:hypothetical protein